MRRLFTLRLTVFLAAFLLFQIELIVGKALLPGFGGSYLVWAACMLFFQTALLMGYGYAHLAATRLAARRYGIIQAVLPLAGLALLPAGLTGLQPAGDLPFIIDVIRLLAGSVGAAFLVISTISINSQNLLAASDLPEAPNPYFLYGTSNLGSFAALVSYPFLVEPLFDLDLQYQIWKYAFAAVAVLQAMAIAGLLRHQRTATESSPDDQPEPTPALDLAYWGLLAAAGTAMFVAVTNLITFDLASVPLLWIAPLAIYLFSFYLNFKPTPPRLDFITGRILLTVPLGVFLFMTILLGYVIAPAITVTAHLLILFVFCMFCQQRLIQAKPASSGQLTSFYLAIAAGGAAGTALVSLAAPLLTSSLTEYLLGFVLLFAALALKSGERGWTAPILAGLAAAVPAVAWPLSKSLGPENLSGLFAALAGTAFAVLFFVLRERPRALAAALLVISAAAINIDYLQPDTNLLLRHRNFFGIYRVYDQAGKRNLRHGATIHGRQYLDSPRDRVPLMYYHPTAPAGELLLSGLAPQNRVAVVGLGAGSLAVYGQPGADFDFYELDPDNLPIAKKYFSYLDQSRARLSFIFGDARLSLARFDTPPYDIIVIDAFNSDSIPVHLVTVEAMDLYRRRLLPQGVMMFHVSNRFLNLVPVIFADAQALGLQALYKTNQISPHPDAEACEWMIVTADRQTARVLISQLHWTDLAAHPPEKTVKPWTDRYSNLLAALLARE